MSAALPALDLTELLKGIPPGAWVAISIARNAVVAYGSDMRAVLKEASNRGERDPLIVRVPESENAVML